MLISFVSASSSRLDPCWPFPATPLRVHCKPIFARAPGSPPTG